MEKQGRPAFSPTKAQREQVELLVADGMAEPSIASVIGICQMTLRKHFVDELANGKARKKAQVMAMLMKSAKKGNVSAQKFLATRLGAVPGSPESGQPLGKKDAANAEARTAHEDTGWNGLVN